ncbi:MAG: hypothetical protein RL701_4663 [Pseudomonadota bacterium]
MRALSLSQVGLALRGLSQSRNHGARLPFAAIPANDNDRDLPVAGWIRRLPRLMHFRRFGHWNILLGQLQRQLDRDSALPMSRTGLH